MLPVTEALLCIHRLRRYTINEYALLYMRNIKMILEYDGTEFCGWQIQPEERTVQGCIEDALLRITRKKVAVTGSGRTDAGVHALGQVCNCFTDTQLSNDELHRALNGVLPGDIAVKMVEDAADDFHARFRAVRRVYRYVIVGRKGALNRRFVWFYPYPLEVEALQSAARLLEGKHDCSAFQSTGSDEENPVCDIFGARWERRGETLNFVIEANRYLRKMVRTIVGTMVDIGRGKMPPADFEEILYSRDRAKAGATAPARGLFLEAVYY